MAIKMRGAAKMFTEGFQQSFKDAGDRAARKEELVAQHANNLALLQERESIALKEEQRKQREKWDDNEQMLRHFVPDLTDAQYNKLKKNDGMVSTMIRMATREEDKTTLWRLSNGELTPYRIPYDQVEAEREKLKKQFPDAEFAVQQSPTQNAIFRSKNKATVTEHIPADQRQPKPHGTTTSQPQSYEDALKIITSNPKFKRLSSEVQRQLIEQLQQKYQQQG